MTKNIERIRETIKSTMGENNQDVDLIINDVVNLLEQGKKMNDILDIVVKKYGNGNMDVEVLKASTKKELMRQLLNTRAEIKQKRKAGGNPSEINNMRREAKRLLTTIKNM